MGQKFSSIARNCLRHLTLLIVGLALLAHVRPASAFSFVGTLEPWMSPVNGFNPLPFDGLPVGPHNLGEEYRRNTPVMYWACDQNFLDYFGSNGVHAIEQAMSAFNAVSDVSSYSLDLSEWPLESQRHNFMAQALQLVDLKSETMGAMMEQMGLVDPVRYTWVIHNRAHIPNTPGCPDGMDYIVVQRNFDPVPSALDQYQTSSYVNGVLYSYLIEEFCTGVNPLADAAEFPVDSEANVYTSVADAKFGLDFGGFYLSLTRDDIGGMRYLLRTNNMNIEAIPPGAVEFVTNQNPQLVFGSNLTLFAAQALTNTAAALQTLYPGLIITATSNTFALVSVTNVVGTLVPGPPWAPAGTFQLVFLTNIVTTPQLQFIHTFGNVASFQLINGQWVLVPFTSLSQVNGNQIVNFQTISVVVTNPPFSPANNFSIRTNVTDRLRIQTGPVGEFIILDTNLCDLQIIANVFTNVIPITNVIATGSNIVVIGGGGGGSGTNAGGTNLFNGQILASTLNQITFFTNHAFFVLPVNCVGTNSFLAQGIEKIGFVRHDFDSLLGRFFQPVTNDYTMNEITNGIIVSRSIRRVITRPDFLFSATDQIGGPAQYPVRFSAFTRNLNLNSANALPGIAGPGTIEPVTTIAFNKTLPAFENFRLDPERFLDELSQLPLGGWGSFDGTTNPPVVYPNGATVTAIENQVLMPIVPDNLPITHVGDDYTQQFSSLGGQPPLSFSLAPGSNPLPPGFSLDSDGTFTGTATTAGTFEFTIRLTDSTGRISDRLYTFVILP